MNQDNLANVVAIGFIGVIGVVALVAILFSAAEVGRELPTIVAGCVGALGGFLGARGLTSLRSGDNPPGGRGGPHE